MTAQLYISVVFYRDKLVTKSHISRIVFLVFSNDLELSSYLKNDRLSREKLSKKETTLHLINDTSHNKSAASNKLYADQIKTLSNIRYYF